MLSTEERNKKIRLLGELENKLISELAKFENFYLMNIFLDWQKLRLELNEDFDAKLDAALSK